MNSLYDSHWRSATSYLQPRPRYQIIKLDKVKMTVNCLEANNTTLIKSFQYHSYRWR